ncbi:hypothetical protein [Streptomyces xantholiticus]|uniref:Uncharacterized protein n=1 Tax=Streptomyces xantholiticus TaxID=68285 RepID=A0ABV1UXT4_9ACTN
MDNFGGQLNEISLTTARPGTDSALPSANPTFFAQVFDLIPRAARDAPLA